MKKSHISASKKALAIFTISVLVLSVFSILPFSQASAQSDEGTTTVSDDGGAPTLADQSALPSTVDPSTDDSTSSVSDSNSQTDNSQTDNSTSTGSSTSTTTDSTSAVTPTPNYPYPCPDFDNDGVVTQNDVNIAKANAGMDNPVFDDGDANLDGYVNAADTILTKSQLGRVCQSPDVTVTLIKYMDGVEATPANANSTSFPMTSTWTAANLNGGVQSSGTFSLSPTGFNTDQPYQAVTSEMSSGADYSAVENIPTDCDGNPYSLQGYKMGDSEADALNSPTVQTASFTNITQNEYILVMNHDCSIPTDNGNTGVISGMKFNDENGNGTEDNGEAGLPNWQINLYSLGDSDTPVFVSSTSTDQNGNYSFNNLAYGTYVVCEVSQTGWNETFPGLLVEPNVNNYPCDNDPSLGAIGHKIQLLNPAIETQIQEGSDNGDFGNQEVATTTPCNVNDSQNVVSDGNVKVDGHNAVVFDSSDASHTPHPAWTTVPGANWISSQPLDGNGSSPTDVTETYTKTFTITGTPTDSTLNIAADNYYTVEVNGHAIDTGNSSTTIDNYSSVHSWDIPAADLQNGTNTISVSVTNPSTDPNTGQPYGDPNPSGVDFNLTANDNGCVIPPPNTSNISGYKFDDENGNGNWDPGEPGLAGWTIDLFDSNGQLITSTVTAEDGSYSFGSLSAGTYLLCEVNQDGWNQTDPSSDQTGGLCGNNSNGYSATVDGTNPHDGDIDFGNEPAGATLTIDKDTTGGDGDFNFFITSNNEDSTSTSIETDGGSGSTVITIPAGTSTISEESQDGWTLATSSCAYDNDAVGINVAGEETINVDNGDHVTCTFINTENSTTTPTGGSISGLKFNDENGNGQQDQGEPGLNDWTITLAGPDENTSTTTITDSNGNYSFTGLADGDYTLCEVLQNGWQQTFPTSESVCDGSNGYEVTIDNADTHPNMDFGNEQIPTSPSGGGGGGGGGGVAPTSGGGGGGGFTFNNTGTLGQVLGTSTGPTLPVVTASSCSIYLTKYMRYGKQNDPGQVTKLQAFLNGFQNSGLPLTGFFGKLTLAAVDLFQISQASYIRDPWTNANSPITNSEWPTGYVYKTTLHRINQIECATLNIPIPPLP